VVICLELGADLHMAQLMPLPLTVSCFSKIQIGFTFLILAYLGSPGKRAVKRVCVFSFQRQPTMYWRDTVLFTFAAERPCSNRSISPVRRAHSSKSAAVASGDQVMGRTDRETDPRQFHRSSSAYYASSVNKVTRISSDFILACKIHPGLEKSLVRQCNFILPINRGLVCANPSIKSLPSRRHYQQLALKDAVAGKVSLTSNSSDFMMYLSALSVARNVEWLNSCAVGNAVIYDTRRRRFDAW